MESAAAGAAATFAVCWNPHILQIPTASYGRFENGGVLASERMRNATLSIPSAPAIPITRISARPPPEFFHDPFNPESFPPEENHVHN